MSFDFSTILDFNTCAETSDVISNMKQSMILLILQTMST